MSKTRIIAGVTACVLVLSIAAGVTALLDQNYDERLISSVSDDSDTDNNDSEADSTESQKVKKAVQSVEYESKLFGDNITNIDIIADEADWQNMIDNASDEEYINVDVNIDGELFENVGIRPKGNSSLQTAESSDSDKYSFKIKFDKYDKEQTCYGLDKLVLNNIISDNTYMKDYLSFDMMKFMGVNSALYNYSYVTVNGEYWGLYISLEGYDKSFLNRTYGDDSGFLYNVKSVDMGEMPQMPVPAETAVSGDEPAVTGEPSDMPLPDESMPAPEFKLDGGFSRSDNGGSLIYTDDDWNSYSSIFDNAVFNRTSEEDYQRVITALEKLSEGQDIEDYFDVDQILRYLAVHTTLVNLDSYSSDMAQNYYIYEKDGKLSILPWDYNLAFGGFSAADSTEAINFPIDTPVSGVSLEDRPLISQLLAVDEYKERYHQYLKQIVDEYFTSGYFNDKIDEITGKINQYVETEPQAFCTYEEYETAVGTLKTFGELRAESIEGQLSGTIPSTSEEQKNDSSALITDENLNLSDMGTQFGGDRNGGGFRGNDRMPPDRNNEMPSTDMQIPQNPDENAGTDANSNGRPDAPNGDGGMPPHDWDNNGERPPMPDGGNYDFPYDNPWGGNGDMQPPPDWNDNNHNNYNNDDNNNTVTMPMNNYDFPPPPPPDFNGDMDWRRWDDYNNYNYD